MKALHFNRFFATTALALSMVGVPAIASAYGSLFIFGDSVSDSGNVALALGLPFGLAQTVTNTYIPSAPYPTDGSTYFPATFSNGPVWSTHFAGMLGKSAAPSLAGGTNFAFSGARASTELPPPDYVPSLTTQAHDFLVGSGGTAPTDGLYVVAAVGNDARDALTALVFGGVNPTAAAMSYADSVGDIVDSLHAAGAQDIVVFNTANLGLTPYARSYGLSTAASDVSTAFNMALDARFSGGGYGYVDFFNTYKFMTNVAASPLFDNVSDACGAAVAGTDCSKYMFWDGIHPTAAMHEVIADAVYAQVVPEPATYGMLLAGLVMVGGVARRRAA